jgi:hypothetical protein
MANNIPLPQRGQPLDLSYIYSLANVVNEISAQVSTATDKYVTIDSVGVGKQTLRSSDIKIVAGYKEVFNDASVDSGSEKDFSYPFDPSFKYPPIVVATVVNVGETPSGEDVSLILSPTTASGTEGVLKFSSSGKVTVGVNIIAIGIPN